MYDKIRKLLPVLSKTASFGYISEPKKGGYLGIRRYKPFRREVI